MTDDSYLQSEWEIDDVDAALADQIIARVVGLWSERGYGPEVDNGPEEGVTTVSSREDEDGFGYSLLANKNQRKVWVHGYTPCLKSA